MSASSAKRLPSLIASLVGPFVIVYWIVRFASGSNWIHNSRSIPKKRHIYFRAEGHRGGQGWNTYQIVQGACRGLVVALILPFCSVFLLLESLTKLVRSAKLPCRQSYTERSTDVSWKVLPIKQRDKSECPICLEEVPVTQSLVLLCRHSFCRNCLASYISSSTSATVICPFPACDKVIQQSQVRQLLAPSAWEAFLLRSQREAEAATANSFHCRTPDCLGWCEVQPGYTGRFLCPVCHHSNCLKCGTQHVTTKCPKPPSKISKYFFWRKRKTGDKEQSYLRQRKLEKLSESKVQKLIRKKKAMSCPGCGCAVQKISGCDHMKCLLCKHKFNWKPGR